MAVREIMHGCSHYYWFICWSINNDIFFSSSCEDLENQIHQRYFFINVPAFFDWGSVMAYLWYLSGAVASYTT